jgi:putative oxidoreductase
MQMLDFYDALTARLRASGEYVWPLVLRFFMAWEFWESGITKLRGKNWFDDIPWESWQKGFPWPFNRILLDLNWQLATWGEIVFSLLILLGLFTRFAAISLIVITAVATAAVHWPAEWNSLEELWKGFAISDKGFGNFKLPLIFIAMLLPLVFHGGGKLSLDHALLKLSGTHNDTADSRGDAVAAGLAFLVLASATVFLEPAWGITFFSLAVVSLVVPALSR